jgi:hypothetical protein
MRVGRPLNVLSYAIITHARRSTYITCIGTNLVYTEINVVLYINLLTGVIYL